MTPRALLLAAFTLALLTPFALAADRPNIVFILADDLGYGELGCYGQQKIRTPNIDRLASQGMRFTQNYAGAPVCAPCRCVLMTGKHMGHAEIRGNEEAKNAAGKFVEGQRPISAEAFTIFQAFKQAGYVTGAMGKWGLGPVGSTGAPDRHGVDLFFGYNCQREAHSYYPSHLWRNNERVEINKKAVPGGKKQPEGEVKAEDWTAEHYAPDLILAEAVKFLNDNKSKPFFLYLPFIEPHVSMQPPKDLVETYPKEWDDRPYRGQVGYLPYPRPHAGYAAMITSLDRHVGKVLATLDELKLAENTIVIFTSDNGTTHGGPGDPVLGVGGVDAAFFNSVAGLRGLKGSVYEGGIRVPYIVRWPGHVKEKSESDFPTYFADQFPTLCAAAGIGPPKGLDGISITPTWTGKGEQAKRNPMIWIYPEYGGQVAVRIGDLKVVRKALQTKKPGDWEVYDIAKDRAETNDLAASQTAVIEQAKALLKAEMSPNEAFPLKVPGVND